MNRVEVLPRDELAGKNPVKPNPLRPAPQRVKVVLPVWGRSYVRQFLECGLSTLLAPGNVPALATALPTEFVILTSSDDEAFISGHPAFKHLAAICETKIRAIDHLIADSLYSVTITLAYTEAVREVGEAMVDTCFFFLVSDYIVADGSLANALRRMRCGTSAVVVGNFQVVREDAWPWLQEKLVRKEHSLALRPREMMQWAFDNLHPATLANTANLPVSHNSHTNRLFWRVDGSTIVGRFYLMHMLCVRPEITDFVIGASCDYSFVPEMCPSGNVEVITDSDEFLVIEMQPRSHESSFLRLGPLKTRVLAESLNEWTTKLHRDNARHSLIFHTGDLPLDVGRCVKEADALVADISTLLTREPAPHRAHPYWIGASAAFHEATEHKLIEEKWHRGVILPAHSTRLTLLMRAKDALLGRPPYVRPWHPYWPDYDAVLKEMHPFLADRTKCILLLSSKHTRLTTGLVKGSDRVHWQRCLPFLRSSSAQSTSTLGTFDFCLVQLLEADIDLLYELVDRIVPLLEDGAPIVVAMINENLAGSTWSSIYECGRRAIDHGSRLIRSGALPDEVRFVPAGTLRVMAHARILKLYAMTSHPAWPRMPAMAILGAFTLCLSLIGNLNAMRRSRHVASLGTASSLVLRLKVDKPKREAIHSYSLSESTPTVRARESNASEI